MGWLLGKLGYNSKPEDPLEENGLQSQHEKVLRPSGLAQITPFLPGNNLLNVAGSPALDCRLHGAGTMSVLFMKRSQPLALGLANTQHSVSMC